MAPYNHVKLNELAQTQNIAPLPQLNKLRQLTALDIPNFVTPISEQRAEECLQQHLQQGKSSKLFRKPTLRAIRNKSESEIRDIIAALPGLVESNEGAGVIQVLLNREHQLSPPKAAADKTQSRLGDCTPLLLKAVEASDTDLVWLLAPRTSLHGRNEALTVALTKRSSDTVKKLLEYHADPNHCSDRFLASAAAADHFIIEQLLSAPTQLDQGLLIQALLPAVRSRSLRNLQRIVGAADLQGLQDVEAVGEAANGGQADALITILLSANNIRPDYLDELVLNVFDNAAIDSASVTAILHTLFYAGAAGPRSSAAMRIAVEKQSLHFVHLFAGHKVDINWGSGVIVKRAVEIGRCDLLRLVLTSGSLSSDNASTAVRVLPRNLPPHDRFELLETLIRAGAHGESVEQELILAVRNNDHRLVTLLRSNGVSIDTNQGDALVAAIQHENVELLGQLLRGPVAQFSLQNALLHVRNTNKPSRLLLTRLLVGAKVEGEAVDVALRDAVCDQTADHDTALIKMLIQAGGSPMYQDAQSIRHAILHQDPDLFEALLRCPAGVSQGVISSLVPEILTVKNRTARLRMMRCSLATRPKEASVAAALLAVVEEDNVDIPLLELITRSGQADINYRDGIVLAKGIVAEVSVLEELMRVSDRSQRTTTTALVKLLEANSFDDEIKATRATILLSSGRTSDAALQGLICYVEFCKASGAQGEDWPMQTFNVLLDAGVDINLCKTLLPDVTRAAAVRLLRVLLTRKPHLASIDNALLEAAQLDSESQAEIVQMILEADPSKNSISSALIRASRANFDDICSILLKHDPSLALENFAAVRNAAVSGNKNLLKVFLEFSLPQEAIDAAFEEAKTIADIRQKLYVMQTILETGVQRKLLSEYLIDQVDRCSQKEMIQLLLDYQADVHHLQNRSLLLASLKGNPDVLQALFAKVINKASVATQCFDESVKNGQVRQDRVPVLSFLLDAGAQGDSLNTALRQAVQNLPSQPGLLPLLDVLLSHGADVNHDQGHALCHACQSTGPEAVGILMKGGSSVKVRSRAMHFLLGSNASESDFCQILDLLMGIGTSPRGTLEFGLAQGEFQNPLKVLLSRRPSGAVELRQVLRCQPQILSQPANKAILAWAMEQPSIFVSDRCLSLLADNGANVNYSKNGESILLQTIRCRRSELVKPLLARGADITVTDNSGTSPLLLASLLGDQLAVAGLLEMGAPKNDGSLHHAVRGLAGQVVEILLKDGHDPDYPSPQYQGRNPLAELLYNGQATNQNRGNVERVIRLLREYGADTRRLVSRKPLICWALDNKHNPVPMVQALLAAYLYKEIDADYNLYSNGSFIFSPTMYVAKRQFTGLQDRADELVLLLRNWGANRDVYYSMMGSQPEDAQGLPEELAKMEMVRRAKLAMRREEEEDVARRRRLDDEEFERERQREEERFQRSLKYRQRMELEEAKIQQDKNALAIALSAKAEDAKQREMYSRHTLQLNISKETADNEQKLLNSRVGIQQREREDELRHRTALSELELQTTKGRLMLESENQRTKDIAAQKALEEQVKVQKQLLLSQDHHHERMHSRRMKQLAMEKAMPVGHGSPVGGGFIEN